jgi:hypothetical protein
MEGSMLSFLKAEWKASDTGSAHWASSLLLFVHFNQKNKSLLKCEEKNTLYWMFCCFFQKSADF